MKSTTYARTKGNVHFVWYRSWGFESYLIRQISFKYAPSGAFLFQPTNLPTIKFKAKFSLLLRGGIKSTKRNFYYGKQLQLQFKI
jgi:hypothetical protein